MPAQKFHSPHCERVGRAIAKTPAMEIVDRRGPVHAQPHSYLLSHKKSAPEFIDKRAVGLYDLRNSEATGIALANDLRRPLIKCQPRCERFACMPQYADGISGIAAGKQQAKRRAECRFRHDGLVPSIRHVAICAIQITERCGLQNQQMRLHALAQPSSAKRRLIAEGIGRRLVPEGIGRWLVPEGIGRWLVPEGIGRWLIIKRIRRRLIVKRVRRWLIVKRVRRWLIVKRVRIWLISPGVRHGRCRRQRDRRVNAG